MRYSQAERIGFTGLIIKILPQNPEPILIQQVFGQIIALGCILPVNVQPQLAKVLFSLSFISNRRDVFPISA